MTAGRIKQYLSPEERISISTTFAASGNDKVEFVSVPLIQIYRSDQSIPADTPVAEFPLNGLEGAVIEGGQSRTVSAEISAQKQPGWYIMALKVEVRSGEGNTSTCTYQLSHPNFMVEYPEGGTRTGEVKLNKVIDINGYSLVVEEISMNARKSNVSFIMDSRLKDCELYIKADDGTIISGLDETDEGSSIAGTKPSMRHYTYTFAPIPKNVGNLTFEIRRVSKIIAGQQEQGEFKDMEGLWIVKTDLD